MAASERLRSLSNPLPCLTVSLRYSTRLICPWSKWPISSRKLLDPRSTAANSCPFFMKSDQTQFLSRTNSYFVTFPCQFDDDLEKYLQAVRRIRLL
jgi:hypothetical protein